MNDSLLRDALGLRQDIVTETKGSPLDYHGALGQLVEPLPAYSEVQLAFDLGESRRLRLTNVAFEQMQLFPQELLARLKLLGGAREVRSPVDVGKRQKLFVREETEWRFYFGHDTFLLLFSSLPRADCTRLTDGRVSRFLLQDYRCKEELSPINVRRLGL